MGLIQHHAIVVSGDEKDVSPVHALAVALGACVSPVSPLTVNSTVSFCVFPDGSKEGWEDSEKGDKARDALIAHLESLRYEDGSSDLDWVEVAFGELGAYVTRAENEEDEEEEDEEDEEEEEKEDV